MSRKYDREFKLEAIRLAAEEGVSARGVEQRLGVSAGIISRWKGELKIQGVEAFPGTGHLGDRDEKVRHPRRELARVSQERDILKKAAAFFANESR